MSWPRRVLVDSAASAAAKREHLEQRRVLLLHLICPQADLSRVGRADCGHVAVDAVLREPLFERTARTLVSLPMIARWHLLETNRLNPEKILRESGKFDYSEPQSFHTLANYEQSYDEYNDDK